MSNKQTFDSVWYGFHVATMVDGRYQVIEDAAICVKNQSILWVGKQTELPNYHAQSEHDLGGGWVTPGLIDCHTHLIFGGNRANEFEQRLNGVSYKTLSENGGGIASSVRSTREESHQQLKDSASRRLLALMKDGVTTLEIKSGYGLSLEHEIKMLQVARSLGDDYSVDIKTTCLAAHALPKEYANRPDDYIDYLCDELLPEISKLGLADAIDAFCEGIGFSPAQVERYFKAAQALGIPVKLHAEQLSSLGGASLAARYQALSADHLEYITEQDVAAMAKNGTVAVLLPGAFFTLKETKKPPIELLRRYQVPIAIATDANPGTSPVLSLRLMMNMACTLFDLTPEEALAGTTVHAAKALGISGSHGEITVGKVADFVCWDVESPGELSYWLGGNLIKTRVKSGEVCHG
ncbi:imidazolonepropionase [Vibrio algarum]|uniref:Imidazolonepropionase n=1 Tax=Vibrio algarum TaxID=3020714 RepID=A0ABT4YRN0_9VIBR|nr:imidazolonepropionase [Vibrio sp. KJ40-1]MDB1124201.1 imidazolonepropionase [Vibrio sp. KJ40-1]